MRGKNYIIGLVAVLLCLVALFSVLSPYFLNLTNAMNIVVATSTIGVLALAACIVIGAGGIDLSSGSLLAFAGISAVLTTQILELHWIATLFLTLFYGWAIGCLNGFIIGFAGLPAFIVTLAMMSIARGGSLLFSDGRPIYNMPEPLRFLGQGSLFGVPMPVILFFSTAFIAFILLRKTQFGRHNLAIGDNPRAAFQTGIKIKRHMIWLYGFSGLLAGLASLMLVARMNAADPSIGISYELTAITAAIIGGTALFGGIASVIGAILGALIMGVLQNGLTLLNVSAYYQQIAIGVALLIAVLLGRNKSGDKL